MPWVMPTPWRASRQADLLQAVPAADTIAHRPGRQGIGETQRRAVDDGGARSRSHQQQAVVGGVALEGDLVFQRDVVAEQQHMQPAAQRLPGFGRGIAPGDGYDCQVGLRVRSDGAAQGLGAEFAALSEAAIFFCSSFSACARTCPSISGSALQQSAGRWGRRPSASGVSKPGFAQDTQVGLGAH